MKGGNWREAKKRELKMRITKLGQKIVRLTNEIVRFGPQRYGSILNVKYAERSGHVRHLYRMAKLSLKATRKKIYRLERELNTL